MTFKIFKRIFQHKVMIGIVLLLVIAGGYFSYQKLTGNNKAVQYATAAVERGTLIVSVSGSGQVVASDQVDIKSKASGEVVAFYINKDQGVKTGQLLAQIDTKNSQQAVSDAEIALESAKSKLEELLSSPDAQSLLQAENALSQAERDLEKAQEDYENIETDAESTLASAYENGYSDVSTMFFKLSDYIKDLQGVLGSAKSGQEYVGSYKLILGTDSPFISRLLEDYDLASDLYNKNFAFFRGVSRDSDRDTVYKLVSDTLETTKAISQALESARHMYDAITASGYTQYYVSATIDKTQPQIESDLSSIFSDINSLQKVIDIIDQTVQDAPGKTKDAELAFKSAQEKVEEKKTALEDLKAGADQLDIKTQQNTVAQKEAALLSAKESLDECSIRASFDGVISKTDVKKGDTISSNTAIATLIANQLVAEINLNEVDAAKVKVGQKATLAFDALPELSISGKVIEVDAVGTISQGVVSYGVKITFDTIEKQVKPGMSVTADIITDAKQDVLVLSNSAIKSQGNSSYVELVEVPEEMRQQLVGNVSGIILPSQPKMQPVEIGLSNDLSAEIVSGLKEGDIVVTSTINPSQTQTSGTQTQSSLRIPGIPGISTGGSSGSQRMDFRGD